MATHSNAAAHVDDGTNVKYGYVAGIVLILIGLAGFAVTGGVDFAGEEGEPLLGFEVNPLHNIVHILSGALLIVGARMGEEGARRINLVFGVTYVAVLIYGILVDDKSGDILAFNSADHILHAALAVSALAVSFMGRTAAASRG